MALPTSQRKAKITQKNWLPNLMLDLVIYAISSTITSQHQVGMVNSCRIPSTLTLFVRKNYAGAITVPLSVSFHYHICWVMGLMVQKLYAS